MPGFTWDMGVLSDSEFHLSLAWCILGRGPLEYLKSRMGPIQGSCHMRVPHVFCSDSPEEMLQVHTARRQRRRDANERQEAVVVVSSSSSSSSCCCCRRSSGSSSGSSSSRSSGSSSSRAGEAIKDLEEVNESKDLSVCEIQAPIPSLNSYYSCERS